MGTSEPRQTLWERFRQWSAWAARGDWSRLQADINQLLHPEQVQTVKVADGEIVSDGATLANLLTSAAEGKVPVEVGFGNKILTFQSRFALEMESDDLATTGTAAYLRRREYVLLAELDRPEGNERVMNTEFLTLHFPTQSKFVEFKTRFLEISDRAEGKKAFKLAFPNIAFYKPQRRGAVRVQIGPSHGIAATVTRAAGVDFEVELADVSMGGVGFVIPRDIAKLEAQSDVEVRLAWPPENTLLLPGKLVRMGFKQNKQIGQVRFTIRSYELTRQLGELVAYAQRKRLSGRVSTGRKPYF